MFYYLSIITTITGMFTLLDLFVEKRAKAKVAEYVFGFGTGNLAGFEYSVIAALLSPFKRNGKLSFKRIFFRYSGAIALFLLLANFFASYVLKIQDFVDYESSFIQDVFEAAIYLIVFTLFFWPFDCWSLWVTNKLFQDKASTSFISFFCRILADIFITITPLFIVLMGMISLLVIFPDLLVYFENVGGMKDISNLREGVVHLYFWAIIAIGFNIIGSLLITAIQIFTLSVGIVVRALLRLTKLNQHLAMVSSAPDFPFTFIGLLCGVIVASMTMILT